MIDMTPLPHVLSQTVKQPLPMDFLREEMGHFEKTLLHLRFEGKPLLGKNIRDTKRVLKFLDDELRKHFQVEEKAIFPFVGRHIPRLEPVLLMLRSDHASLRNQIRKMKEQLRNFSLKRGCFESGYGKSLKEIQNNGRYIICVLNNYLKAEGNIVYKAIKRELHPEEEKLLWKEVSRLLKLRRPSHHGKQIKEQTV